MRQPPLSLTPDALRAWRSAMGITQREAAEMQGVNIRSWQKWEGGERDIPAGLLDMIRYRTMCRDELRELALTFSEACLICDALNGYLTMDVESYKLWWVEIADHISLNGADVKWGVNGSHLLARLRALSPGGKLAVLDAAERFWERADEPTEQVLREIGLTREEAPPKLPEWLREGPGWQDDGPPVDGDDWKAG